MLEQEIWERVTAPIIGGVDPRVAVERLPDQRRIKARLRSTFQHRPGSGYVQVSVSRDLADEPFYPDFLEHEFRSRVASLCPYARQFLEVDHARTVRPDAG